MKRSRLCVAIALVGLCVASGARKAPAQVTINIGVAPVCPYGYYNYAPYSCAPFGYYGPQWFTGGVFIGAGPWFRGPEGFHGYVNRDYDPRFGYRGQFPQRGERPDWGRHEGWEKHFRGNEIHEEHRHDNGHHYGQDKDKDHGNGHGHDDGHGKDHDHGHDRD
ncbi:MAG TPA: hypothetical protein VKB38_00945 [Terracidiphilus sp.]|nr:hypothetical protein [Terracidiphilus sp.]